MTIASAGNGVMKGTALHVPSGNNIYTIFLLSILLTHIKNL